MFRRKTKKSAENWELDEDWEPGQTGESDEDWDVDDNWDLEETGASDEDEEPRESAKPARHIRSDHTRGLAEDVVLSEDSEPGEDEGPIPEEPGSRDLVIWAVIAFLVMGGLMGAALLLFWDELSPWGSELLYPTGRMIKVITQSANGSERRWATQKLIDQEDPETVRLLIAAARRSQNARESLESMRSQYLAELRSGSGNARVVMCLGEITDEEVRAALVQALRRDRYPEVREAAAMTLGDAPRTKPVLDALLYATSRDHEIAVRSAALVSLDQLEATIPVRSTLEVIEQAVVVNDAGWPDGARSAKRIVLRNVGPVTKIDDFKQVADVYSELIQLGIPETEDVLIDTLWGGVGTAPMAQDFINSGNERLRVAGEEWAEAEGYDVKMGTLPGGSRWGGF